MMRRLLVLALVAGSTACGGGGDGGETPNPPAPVANADTASVESAKSVSITVLANDDGDSLSLDVITSAPQNGTATIAGSEIVYRSDEGFAGTDTFSYQVRNAGGTATAVVEVTVNEWSEVIYYKQDDDGLYRWYLADTETAGNHLPLGEGTNVIFGAFVDMTLRVLVYARYSTSGPDELVMVPLDGGEETVLSDNLNLGARKYLDMDVENDLVYYSEVDPSSGELTVFQHSLNNVASRTAVVGPMDVGANETFYFDIHSDTDRLLYVAGPLGEQQLYAVELDAPATVSQLSPAGGYVDAPLVMELENNGLSFGNRQYPSFNASGDAVYYLYWDGSYYNLYRTLLSAPGMADTMHPPLEAGHSVTAFRAAPDSEQLVLVGDFGDGVQELYSVDPATPTVLRKLNSALVSGGDVGLARFVSDGKSVVYGADANTDEVTELYYVDVTTNGTAVRLNATPPADYDVSYMSEAGTDGIVYRTFKYNGGGYAAGSDSVLYVVNRNAPGTPTQLTQSSADTGHAINVRGVDFNADGSKVLYYADETVDNQFDLVLYDIAAGTRSTLATDVTYMIIGFID